MDIVIRNGDNAPIYDQISRQIRDQVLDGTVAPGSPLPSIRSLAADLHVSVITTKRAYAELEKDGFVETVPGKGTFVRGGDLELLREERLHQLERKLQDLMVEATLLDVTVEELHEMVDLLAQGD